MSEPFDIAPYALPRTPLGELRFEEPRDIERVVVRFRGSAPTGISYLHRNWPHNLRDPKMNPSVYGWTSIDDLFNTTWKQAHCDAEEDGDTVTFQFHDLEEDMPGVKDGKRRFRQTLGIRVDGSDIADVAVFTSANAHRSQLKVEWKGDIGITASEGYDAEIEAIVSSESGALVSVRHIEGSGLVTITLGETKFTVSIASLLALGPIWFADRGVYVRFAEDPTTLEQYIQQNAGAQTITEKAKARPEHTYAAAYNGQPRPHAVAVNVGCKHSWERFWFEPTGDIVISGGHARRMHGRDYERYRGDCDVRLFFGLQRWHILSRKQHAGPAPIYSIVARQGDIEVEQTLLAVPGEKAWSDRLQGDDAVVALVRFRFTNYGQVPEDAGLQAEIQVRTTRSWCPFNWSHRTDELLPLGTHELLVAEGARLTSQWEGRSVVRCVATPSTPSDAWIGKRQLAPGESYDVVLAIPFAEPQDAENLVGVDFEKALREADAFWRAECAQGAQLDVPEPHFKSLHQTHISHVQITDFAMPDDPSLVNTSVGTSTYGNYTNESAMIVRDLDERGMIADARSRCDLWVKYQGTVSQPGNFTDCEGMYFGAGGFEDGAYNQHHGWALWCMSGHYLITRDDEWFSQVADSIIAGADWIFRQRKNTMADLPHSHGWEKGFLPAGSLEDVEDFHYWLSTNVLTWRGAEYAARALEAAGHPEAARVRREADAYRADLLVGLRTSREYSPLIRLRDGRWVPHQPSRLYRRGRDVGWIRETLEGSVYLLIAGLIDPSSEEGQWILDDFQDCRYPSPPYGYYIDDFEDTWYARAGFSIQPNLLAGMIPYLDRDEPEVFLWMFYNGWCACYREEANCMSEHPQPYLGFSNSATFKTSDQANALMWLRYMLVYANDNGLYIGRAKPSSWKKCSVSDLHTPYGKVSVEYSGNTATVELDVHDAPPEVTVRFRGIQVSSATVNGAAVDLKGQDVPLPAVSGRYVVEVSGG